MTTLAQAQDAITLAAELDALNHSVTILAAMAKDGVATISVEITTPAYTALDGSSYAGVRGPVTVPLATAQQVILAEQAAVQAEFNALGITA